MRALITGITGQFSVYLAKSLLDRGYKVFGTFRRASTPNFWRIMCMGLQDKITFVPADLIDGSSLTEAIKRTEPDEVYNIGASSYVADAFEQPIYNTEVTGLGVTKLLEAVRVINPSIKFFQMGSSEMFGNTYEGWYLNEKDQFKPASPYAAAKVYGYHMTKLYREAYGMFCVNAIIFNTESPYRGLEFVTRKITNAVARIKLGLQKRLVLGNLAAKRDWNYVPDTVNAVLLMMLMDQPDDYVIATGDSHSVREFAEYTLHLAGLPLDLIESDSRYLRPLDVGHLIGDATKIRELGWRPTVMFKELIEIMYKEDLSRWTSHLAGEAFPWDAPLYPNEMEILTRCSI